MPSIKNNIVGLANYFVFGNIFIAICAVTMAWYTFAVFNSPVNYTLIAFIFFASISSYSFHSFLPTMKKEYSEKVNWSLPRKKYFLALLIIGAAGSIFFLFFLKQDLKLILSLILFTVLYSSPKIKFEKFTFFKKFGTAKTLYLAAIWTLVTVSLPLSSMDSFNSNQSILFFANRFLLIYAICILFDLKDKEYDIQRGIKSVVTIFEEKKIHEILITCTILFFISSIAFYIFNKSVILISSLIIPGIILLFLLEKSKTTKSDYWFSFVLDGLMMLSPVLYFLFINAANLFF
jgi:4-hydroxybenzoate polyprenyltransferase